ncbi:hypothetical protein [uncultured Gammaproteobacteria bacterium]|jgi:hypothetical protein|nr:hypothetical protein [uncultured Gammaproteobacteria bacterium]
MKKVREISGDSIVPIVGDGAIATEEVGEGRMIPLVVIDCSEKVEFRDLIYAHENLIPGDVNITWVTPRWGNKKVGLLLEFKKPSVLEVLFQFDIKKQGIVVDAILHSNALYIQPEESESKVSKWLEKARILIEIPDTGFLQEWDKRYTKTISKNFKKSGFSRAESKKATEEFKIKAREIWAQRMKQN